MIKRDAHASDSLGENVILIVRSIGIAGYRLNQVLDNTSSVSGVLLIALSVKAVTKASILLFGNEENYYKTFMAMGSITKLLKGRAQVDAGVQGSINLNQINQSNLKVFLSSWKQ